MSTTETTTSTPTPANTDAPAARRRTKLALAAAIVVVSFIAAAALFTSRAGSGETPARRTVPTVTTRPTTSTTSGFGSVDGSAGIEVEVEQPAVVEPEVGGGGETEEPEPQVEPSPPLLQVPAKVTAKPSGQATIELVNAGGTPLLWAVNVPERVTVGNAPGEIAPGESAKLPVTIDMAGLKSGKHSFDLQLTSDGGDATVTVSVTVLGLKPPITPPTPPTAPTDKLKIDKP